MERTTEHVIGYSRVNRAKRALVADREAELVYIRRAKGGDLVARNILLESQLMSLYGIALKRNFTGYRGDATEMVDVVAIHFDSILAKFDETRGVRLFTHLVQWARHYMGVELIADRAGVLVPANVFKAGQGDDVAKCVWGDAPVSDESDATLFDGIGDDRVDVFGDAVVREHSDMVERYMTELDDLEKEVIRAVYLDEVSMRDVGVRLGIGKGAVAGIRNRALAKMRERAIMEADNCLDGHVSL